MTEPVRITVDWQPEFGLLPFGTAVVLNDRVYAVHGCSLQRINLGGDLIVGWDGVQLDLVQEAGRTAGALWAARKFTTRPVLAAWVAEAIESISPTPRRQTTATVSWHLFAAGPGGTQRWPMRGLKVTDDYQNLPDGSRWVDARALQAVLNTLTGWSASRHPIETVSLIGERPSALEHALLAATLRLIDPTCPEVVQDAALLDWGDAFTSAAWAWVLDVLYSKATPGAAFAAAADRIEGRRGLYRNVAELRALADPDVQQRIQALSVAWEGLKGSPGWRQGSAFRQLLSYHASLQDQIDALPAYTTHFLPTRGD